MARAFDSKIRPAKAADTIAITAIVQAAYRHYIDRLGYPPAPMQTDYEQAIAKGDIHIAESEATMLGVMVLRDDDAGFVLDNIAVGPD